MKQLEKKKGHASKENTKPKPKESITPFLNSMLWNRESTITILRKL